MNNNDIKTFVDIINSFRCPPAYIDEETGLKIYNLNRLYTASGDMLDISLDDLEDVLDWEDEDLGYLIVSKLGMGHTTKCPF